MKITDQNLGGAQAPETQRSQEIQSGGRSGNGRSAGSVSDGGDSVEFSGTLGRLSRTLSSSSSDRASRVQALAAQYQSGTYRSDSAATSRGIVSEALSGGSPGAHPQ
jgi:hypothetical protein